MASVAPHVAPVFGQLVSALAVEDAVQATLARWSVTYLAEVERQHGIPPQSLPDIRSYQTFPTFDHWPENQLPACVIVCPGMLEPPQRRGSGIVDATFGVAVAVVVAGRDEGSTRRLSMLYADMVRGAIGQHPSLGGIAERTVPDDERYDPIATSDSRTLAACQVVFRVDVAGVLDMNAGPVAVPFDPYAEPGVPGVVERIIVDVEKGATDA